MIDGPIPDKRFLDNVREARESGYDLVCSECGSGINDDSDFHDVLYRCSLDPDPERIDREMRATR